MVSAYLADALRDPTSEIKELYATHDPSKDFVQLVVNHFSKVFSSDAAFEEIPILRVQNSPLSYRDRSLVRFRAMVQDTSPSSEMYLQRIGEGTPGGWGIHAEAHTAASSAINYSDLRECNVLWAVSVPGESHWCSEELDGVAQEATPSLPSTDRAHKYPTPGSTHVGVQVKIYDNSCAEKLRSTDIATFVGILTREPLALDDESSSEVPTLHVLFARIHDKASLSRPYPQASVDIPTIRSELIDWIAEESLGSDREAAEWVLLASIARVESRNPPLLPPSITLSHFPSPPIPSSAPSNEAPLPPTDSPTLSHVLSQLLPLSSTLPLSLELFNKVPFAPESKDEDLHSGVLQLPKGSVLLVTEGGIREGKLVERGLTNIGVLQEVMTSQSLAYVFPFSRFSFPTDIECIILTEGKKSTFFKTDLSVPFRPNSNSPEDVSRLYKGPDTISLPAPEKLAAFRSLIVGAQQGKVRVGKETSEGMQYIQQEFVRDRQQDQSVTSDDLIRRMTVAKLYALSLHEEELTVDTWERAKACDERRKARVNAA
ncbi:hypothetical protein NM688_g3664 [Phlebia brevispora]|uniref:Uncharacterized protein n=1 Tax=Phlebia brevispora TaxID=194682 RepID=A0ACC1T4X0_9APHY|nr:hypothetical protein NM688_g3664 [Phlebia brevispora]